MQTTTVADPGGQSGHGPLGGPWPDWPLSNCKLTSLTSFFCCDHHNNKRRLRFNTVFLWLTPTSLQTYFGSKGAGGGACPYLLPFNSIFMGLLKKTATGQGCKFAVSVGRPRAKMLSASAFSFRGGALPPDPLTRGSAPGPRWGLRPQTPVIGSRSALAMWPP